MDGRRMVAAAGVALAALAISAPATAAAASTGGAAPTAAPPSCLRTDTGTRVAYNFVDVTNNCNRAYSVVADIQVGRDSRCMHLTPGETKTDRFGPQAQFGYLRWC